MPNRMLRDWTNSDKIDQLSAPAEVLFTRLIMKADDYGCFWADPKRVKANLYPLKSDSIRDADISRWMAECQKAGLIAVYESDDKKYLQINDFNQRLRTKSRKFPEPRADDRNVRTHDRNVPPEVEEKLNKKEEKETAHPLENSNMFRKPVIPTKQQVWEWISSAGGTKEMAKAFYEKHEATGWYLNGSPIVNVSALASKFVDSWRRNQKEVDKSQPPSGPPVSKIPKEFMQ